MRKLLFGVILLLITSCCSNKKHIPEFDEICELRVFNAKTSIESNSEGAFFLMIGAFNSNTKEVTKYYFYIKNKNNEYCRFDIAPKKVKIKFNLNTIPTIKFDFNTSNWTLEEILSSQTRIQKSLDWYGGTVTITCNPEQFPQNVNLTTLQ